MHKLSFEFDGNVFRITEYPDAAKLIALDIVPIHKRRALADMALHSEDLRFAQECLSNLEPLRANSPFIAQALWRCAILYYCKCFGKPDRARGTRLPISKYLPKGPPRQAHAFFLGLRDKHLAHDENAWHQTMTGAIVAAPGKGYKIEEVVCMTFALQTLGDGDLGNLRNLVQLALAWTESEFQRLTREITTQLEGQPYESLLAQPAPPPFRGPTAEEVHRTRNQA